MNSLFPILFNYSEVAPLLIRVVAGVTLGYFGYQKIIGKGASSGSNSPMYGRIEFFIAILMVIGLYTQLAALINVLILIIKIGFKASEEKLFSAGINYYVLLLAMTLSLLFSGPGYLAIDRFI